MHPFFIIVSGPTAVGKTDFIDKLITQLPFACAIVNGDMGQMYTPLSIGTAKPQYQDHPVQHYLFDVISEPKNFTVDQYRVLVIEAMKEIWNQKKIPIIIGGSGFYLKSLFFAPYTPDIIGTMPAELALKTTHELYEQLISLDAARAKVIDKNDRYRILRALEIWYTTGILPSQIQPVFTTPAACYLLFLERDVAQLDARIYQRTKQMITHGWIEEVASLNTQWKDFLLEKKIIGYPEIIKFLENGEKNNAELAASIGLKTRQYAKKQRIFFQLFKRQLEEAATKGRSKIKIETTNLTLSGHTLYLEDTVKALTHFMEQL